MVTAQPLAIGKLSPNENQALQTFVQSLLKKMGVTAFMILLPSGADFDLVAQIVFDKWWQIKKICQSEKLPLVCKMPVRGKYTFL